MDQFNNITIPTEEYNVIFNETEKQFEIWQANFDFNTRALLMTISIDEVIQQLKETIVKSLINMGGTINES